MRSVTTRWLLVMMAALSCFVGGELTFVAPAARAGVLYLTSCSSFGDNGQGTDIDGLVWQAKATGTYSLYNRCRQHGAFQIATTRSPGRGQTAQWLTVAPPGIEIVHARTPAHAVTVDHYLKSDGYKASFFWHGGTERIFVQKQCCGGLWYGSGIDRSISASRWFGFQVKCSYSPPCANPAGHLLEVSGIELEAIDKTLPRLTPVGSGNLWYQSARWVRGTWPASFEASASDGVCGMEAIVSGKSLAGPVDSSPNRHSWTQCPDPQTMNLTLDTTRFPNGPLSLTLAARDAASPANVAVRSETLRVDNQPVTLSLSGPRDAPATAGTQYVTATAAAGPSGVADIDCSLDGAAFQAQRASSARIAVRGIGVHQVVCFATNHSIDSSGVPAVSLPESWTLSIREPTVFAIGFPQIVDRLRCRRVREYVEVPGRSRVTHRDHKVVRTRRPSHIKQVWVRRCYHRTAERRITTWATVTRDGKKKRVRRTKRIRVVLFPHLVTHSSQRVRHGHSTTVGGWLGTASGTALAGATVVVKTAPANGLGHFDRVAVVMTGSDGTWRAHLPSGPSRLVEAIYQGGSLTEPSNSAQDRLTVPAKLRLNIRPRHTQWGATIQIWGRVLGGYTPQGKLLRLRIGVRSVKGTVGIPNVQPNGRFHTTFTFAHGTGTVRYWFSVSTLREADYPFAPASSRRVYVRVR
jgi:hypothetical protein